MFGSPTPTKQTRCPASSRAAATIIISDLLNAASVIGAFPRAIRPTSGPRREPNVVGAAEPRAAGAPTGPNVARRALIGRISERSVDIGS